MDADSIHPTLIRLSKYYTSDLSVVLCAKKGMRVLVEFVRSSSHMGHVSGSLAEGLTFW